MIVSLGGGSFARDEETPILAIFLDARKRFSWSAIPTAFGLIHLSKRTILLA
jgi:hypothetical protein